jgi:hypothetical protein
MGIAGIVTGIPGNLTGIGKSNAWQMQTIMHWFLISIHGLKPIFQ